MFVCMLEVMMEEYAAVALRYVPTSTPLGVTASLKQLLTFQPWCGDVTAAPSSWCGDVTAADISTLLLVWRLSLGMAMLLARQQAGCNPALVPALEELYHINFMASTDATGNATSGGDWKLETDNFDFSAAYCDVKKLERYRQTLEFTMVSCCTAPPPPPFMLSWWVTGGYFVVHCRGRSAC
jgi:hypothetical protein